MMLKVNVVLILMILMILMIYDDAAAAADGDDDIQPPRTRVPGAFAATGRIRRDDRYVMSAYICPSTWAGIQRPIYYLVRIWMRFFFYTVMIMGMGMRR